jgi:hypothetical protein
MLVPSNHFQLTVMQHSNLFGQFVSFVDNEILWIQPQASGITWSKKTSSMQRNVRPQDWMTNPRLVLKGTHGPMP